MLSIASKRRRKKRIDTMASEMSEIE